MATRYRAEEIAPLLALREQDGLSFAELSRRTGIKTDTLRRWDRKLWLEQPDDAPSFAPVDVIDDDARAASSTLSIRIGAATIEVNGTVERSALQTIVDVLVSRC